MPPGWPWNVVDERAVQVPQSHHSIRTSRRDLSAVRAERDGPDSSFVPGDDLFKRASAQVPYPHRAVVRPGYEVHTVRAEFSAGNLAFMTAKLGDQRPIGNVMNSEHAIVRPGATCFPSRLKPALATSIPPPPLTRGVRSAGGDETLGPPSCAEILARTAPPCGLFDHNGVLFLRRHWGCTRS